jgi:hypothetical protein
MTAREPELDLDDLNITAAATEDLGVRKGPLIHARWSGTCPQCFADWDEDDQVGYVNDELVCRHCHRRA